MLKILITLFAFYNISILPFTQKFDPISVNQIQITKNTPTKYAGIILKYCQELDIPISIASNLCHFESCGYKQAYNDNKTSYDVGLYQINSKNFENFAKWYNEGRTFNPYNPEQNIKIGLRHLKSLYLLFHKNWYFAAVAYNCGQYRVFTKPKISDILACRVVSE